MKKVTIAFIFIFGILFFIGAVIGTTFLFLNLKEEGYFKIIHYQQTTCITRNNVTIIKDQHCPGIIGNTEKVYHCFYLPENICQTITLIKPTLSNSLQIKSGLAYSFASILIFIFLISVVVGIIHYA